ncbi:OPT/YSL family transporter [Anaeromyxobacter dehalogenans]|uniref:Oligopeptide transporter, OPT superfamily n=1 Tax=Anaeromyxobacter dehalogenans (strain 2CP-C) TaxID=290397 RepID=Q2IGZ5_ANADE|nr:OPT/YSL family transporter [Anaeromyxobacter dehalogenans]ABC83856.1 Oligopeptide transporter, OPT superfamily [Anaeromyxobacter dehalogenans 2CP-C]
MRKIAQESSTAAPGAAGAPHRELTVRAVCVAVVVAALMGAAEPTVVLRIGYGPNISVVSAFLGFIALSLLGLATRVRATRWETNLVQTAGTAAGSGVGFMSVVLAAIDMLNQRGLMSLHLSPLQIFAWLAPSGMLGVLLAVPLRKHYIDQENLTFADGTAAGETLLVLDQGPKQAGPRVAALGLGGAISAGFVALRQGLGWIPETISFRFLTPHAEALRVGSEVGVLSLGAGLLIGLRVTLSMALGMVLAWLVAPEPLFRAGLVPELTFNSVLQRWIMWPATGLMVAGGLTALVLNRKVIAKTFRGMSSKGTTDGGDFPMRWVVWGAIGCTVVLVAVQKLSLGFPIWLSLVSVGLSLVLMLVGIRVLGETNWAPISAMANVMQAVFAVLAPGHVPINMVGSGMSGSVAANGEHLMQDYKAGKIVGSTNRNLTILQLVGVPVGALAVAIAYPAVRAKYGIGGEGGLTSPISVKWAGFAELLSQGFGALAPSAVTALGLALVVGVVLTVLESHPRIGRFVPSPSAVGLGMLIPGFAIFPMVVGGLVQDLWKRLSPRTEAIYNTPLASGFITGEALVLLVLALLAF